MAKYHNYLPWCQCQDDHILTLQLKTLWLLLCQLGDHVAIAKETGQRLDMDVNMYPSSSLLGQNMDVNLEVVPVDELIEKDDGFSGVFPGA